MRKMATIKTIDKVLPIEKADSLEVAYIGGWPVVIRKGEYMAGDTVVYCEPDSWVPHDLAPFLSKGKEPKEYDGVKGERLRTVKLRGQLSQGLILPLSVIPPNSHTSSGELKDGDDVSAILGVVKYEPPVPAQLAGLIKGNFPSFIPKTDQERVQNIGNLLAEYRKHSWEVTEKLDGSSMTVYINEGEVGVCSRNLDLKDDDNNTFWKVAKGQGLLAALRDYYDTTGSSIAIQGELVGEGIQGNKYKINGHRFYLFDVWDIDKQEYYYPWARGLFCSSYNILHVPVVDILDHKGLNTDISLLLEYAEGKSEINPGTEREGVVFKSRDSNTASFKAISNKWLLKNE